MGARLHVDNLSVNTTEADLENLFNRAGLVLSVSIPVETRRGSRRRFGLVNMGSADAAEAAIKKLSGWMLHNHQLAVTLADANDQPTVATA